MAQAFNLSNGREGDPSPPQRNIGEQLFPEGALLDGDKSRPWLHPSALEPVKAGYLGPTEAC